MLQAIDQLGLRLTKEQIAKHRKLIKLLLDEVSTSLLKTEPETMALELEYDLNNFFYHDGVVLEDTVEIISTFRLSLLHEIQRKGLFEHVDTLELADFYQHIIRIFDAAIRNTTKNFNIEHQKALNRIEQEIMELAAPIVPIHKGLAILPLIGNFSQLRTSYIASDIIPRITNLHVDTLVLDFSGMLDFDTHVAQQIFHIRDTLQLLGIQPIITGIRPSIAQTAVALGIDIKDLKTYGTVQQFLEVFEHQQKSENMQKSH